MGIPDIIAIAVILLVMGLAIWYIVKSKKSGKKCIGCPYAEECKARRERAENSCNCKSVAEQNTQNQSQEKSE